MNFDQNVALLRMRALTAVTNVWIDMILGDNCFKFLPIPALQMIKGAVRRYCEHDRQNLGTDLASWHHRRLRRARRVQKGNRRHKMSRRKAITDFYYH